MNQICDPDVMEPFKNVIKTYKLFYCGQIHKLNAAQFIFFQSNFNFRHYEKFHGRAVMRSPMDADAYGADMTMFLSKLDSDYCVVRSVSLVF